MTQPAFDFTKLSPEERLDLIGEIWDSLENEQPPISPELQAELDRRLAELERNPSDGLPAAEVIARIRATLK
jgi:putative addiction module component (TIGR02574 family)